MEKILKNRQLLIIIVMIVLVIIGSTFAWFTWNSNENTNVNLTIGNLADIKYITGKDINITGIGPVLDYNDGETTKFSVSKRVEMDVYTSIYLTINELPDELKTESFKCKVLSSTDNIIYNELYEMNFLGKNINTKYKLLDLDEVAIGTKFYKIIFFIDGNMENNITMMNKTFQAIIDVDVNNGVSELTYTGGYQEYVARETGYYKIELWGASGGNATYNDTYEGGKGGYTKGIIELQQGEKIYIYVGGEGPSIEGTSTFTIDDNGNGYNGGSPAIGIANDSCGSGSGGATDIRLVAGEWDDTSSLISRIMVAGGGGGSQSNKESPYYSGTGGNGGNVIGSPSKVASSYCNSYGYGGTQTGIGKFYYCIRGDNLHPIAIPASLGVGGTTVGAYGAGGGGYYGGSAGLKGPGGGGSSYISGYAGVDSLNNSTTLVHNNNTLHYSRKYFINSEMQSGVNVGNGKAKIEFVGIKPERINTKLNNVRYIKDCATGNSASGWVYWDEIQAIEEGINIAYNKPYYTTTSCRYNQPCSAVVDGLLGIDTHASTSTNDFGVNKCIVIDLGAKHNLDEIAVWHTPKELYPEYGVFYNNITYVSSDEFNSWSSNTDSSFTWTEVINSIKQESYMGKRVNAYEHFNNGYIQDDLIMWLDGKTNQWEEDPINNTLTTWKDLSGHANNGYLENFSYNNTSGWVDNSVLFDGINDYVTTYLDLYPLNQSFTMEIVAKINNVSIGNINNGSAGILFGTGDNEGAGIIWQAPNANTLNINGVTKIYSNPTFNSANLLSKNTLSTDINLYTLVNDHETNKNRYYLNGHLIGEYDIPTGTYSRGNYYDEIGINLPKLLYGSYTPTYANMNAYGARIYEKALTEEEILNNYSRDRAKYGF